MSLVRRGVGAVWLAVWAVWLVFLLDLWSRLGGLVDEQLRWTARMAVALGPVIGYAVGLHAREMAGWGSGRSHATLLRLFWTPAAGITALVLVGLSAEARHDEARVVLGAFTAYWAGFDAAMAAWPLLWGRPYRFTRDIPPETVPNPQGDDRDRCFWGPI